jgi:hypothetical protein
MSITAGMKTEIRIGTSKEEVEAESEGESGWWWGERKRFKYLQCVLSAC